MKLGSGSSEFFVVTAVIFRENFAASACDRSIDEFRRTLKCSPRFEFHFTNCRDALREQFLRRMATEAFCYYAFVLNKAKLYAEKFQRPDEVYQTAAEFVCDNARHLFTDAKVTIDKTGDRAFRKRLDRALKSRMTDPDGTCRIRKIGMEHSHSNNLVQLADMICGAVARDYNGGQTTASKRFREIVKRKEERVQFWPK